MNKTTVEVVTIKNEVIVTLVDVHTVNYGFNGFMQYEGVEPIVDSD